MEWVLEWDTVMWTNLSSVLSSCNLKRKEKSVFNKESRISGTKGGEEKESESRMSGTKGGEERKEKKK